MKAWLTVEDRSAVAVARRMARSGAAEIGLDDTRAEEAAIVASEMAMNIVVHAGAGKFLAQVMPHPDGPRLGLVAIDEGPGVEDPDRMLRDGESSRGSAGIGFGAMRRLSHRFDIFTRPGVGVVVACEFVAGGARAETLDIAGLVAAHPHEDLSGDAWFSQRNGAAVNLMLCDGLGHGPPAAAVAEEAIEFARARPGKKPLVVLTEMAESLKRSRGVVASLLRIDYEAGLIDYANLGNISTLIMRGDDVRRFNVRDGVVGAGLTRPTAETHPFAPGDLLLLHSDGIVTVNPKISAPVRASRSSLLIAGWLLHHCFRGRDDASVAVVQWNA